MAFYAGKCALGPGSEGDDQGLIQIVAARASEVSIGIATQCANAAEGRIYYTLSLKGGGNDAIVPGEYTLVDGVFVLVSPGHGVYGLSVSDAATLAPTPRLRPGE